MCERLCGWIECEFICCKRKIIITVACRSDEDTIKRYNKIENFSSIEADRQSRRVVDDANFLYETVDLIEKLTKKNTNIE